jgi:hypothetical protein
VRARKKTKTTAAEPFDPPRESRHLVSGTGMALPILLPAEQHERLARLAEKSGVTVEAWLDTTLAAAMANDEHHWTQVEDRERMAAQVDRGQWARLSMHLANLPEKVKDLLVERAVLAREQGRLEGFALRALLMNGAAPDLICALHDAGAGRGAQ